MKDETDLNFKLDAGLCENGCCFDLAITQPRGQSRDQISPEMISRILAEFAAAIKSGKIPLPRYKQKSDHPSDNLHIH